MGTTCRRTAYGGSSLLMTTGVLIMGLCASVFAIDLPTYFNARNQLQTAVDAAALAGAANLPTSQADAEDAATSMAAQNTVAGQTLDGSELTFTSTNTKFTVVGKVEVPTIMGKLLCGFANATGASSGGGQSADPNADPDQFESGGSDASTCNTMTVVAGSSAAPAARDTILVIDTSNSMDDLGYGRPMKDVKSAAISYINMIAQMQSDSVDRIGLVTFDQTGVLQKSLKSQSEDPGYNSLISTVNGLRLFSGMGWNTNYEAGLNTALDEMQANGRPNAQKIIIFMTDGMPNLPAPSSYYSYSRYEPYTKCTDIVDNSADVRSLCVRRNGRKICPVLPSSQIPDRMISSSATSCAVTYVNNMESATNEQTDRAKDMDVTINTVNISDTVGMQNSEAIWRRLLKNPDWEPDQLEYMADTTKGEQYQAANYDADRIREIYETIAQDIHIRLAQ